MCAWASFRECPLWDLDLPITEVSGPMWQPTQQASDSGYPFLWFYPAVRHAAPENPGRSLLLLTPLPWVLCRLSFTPAASGGLMEPGGHFWVLKSSGQSHQNLDQLSSRL